MNVDLTEINTLSGDSLNSDFHDLVNNFDIEYKVTTPSQLHENLTHYHECFEIILYIEADIHAYHSDIYYNLHSRDLLIIPPRSLHKIMYPHNQLYIRYVFYFTSEQVKKAFPHELHKKVLDLFFNKIYRKVSLTAPAFLRLTQLFKNLYHHKKRRNQCDYYILDTYSSIIFQEIYLIYKNQTDDPAPTAPISTVEKILKYINEHYAESITLEDFENKFYLSKYYICRLFHKTMGVSLIEYLQCKRILEAQHLLINTDAAVIDISLECGFNNIQHFYRIFKKITQMTPKQFKSSQKSDSSIGRTISLKS